MIIMGSEGDTKSNSLSIFFPKLNALFGPPVNEQAQKTGNPGGRKRSLAVVR